MVRVAVEHRDPRRISPPLEPAPNAGELDDHALGLGTLDTGELERRDRGRGIPAVVLTRHRELELDRIELLRAHDVRHGSEPTLEEVYDLGARAERRVVIE